MTSAQIPPAQIPPRPMGSRNPVAGDAPESNSGENEVSTESLNALPSGLCVWIFGDARGVSVSHSAKRMATQDE